MVEYVVVALGGTREAAETMAARRANSRREIEDLLFSSMVAPGLGCMLEAPLAKLQNWQVTVNFVDGHDERKSNCAAIAQSSRVSVCI